MAIASVALCPTGEQSQAAAEPSTKAAGPSVLGVKVRITGHYEDRIPANYFYASLLSRDGSRYLPVADGCEPRLSGAPLLPGQSREGYVNFPLQAKKGAYRLAYAPNLERTTHADTLPRAGVSIEVPLP